ncbi:hypothetical protein B566_EDAN016701 [Ephemera danica]|nr:hypothetical protein B566_EDAN016701 [Ephemera danica]
MRQRELDRDRQKLDWERKERQQEEQRRQDEELMRRQQEEMQMRMLRQEEDMRRRQQENSLFMQAHQLNSLLDQQEQAMRSGGGGGAGGAGGYGMDADYDQALPGDGYTSMRGSGGPGNLPVDPKAFMDSYDRVGGAAVGGGGGGGLPQGGRYDAMDDMRGGPGGAQGMGRQRWGGSGGSGGDRRPLVDDYPNKRRRY